jgi:fumarate hydratase class I
VNPVPELRQAGRIHHGAANKLGIGTMGFGGNVTLLGCKIGAINRLPASFFVSVAYNCWAFRRQGVLIDAGNGEIKEWLYERGEEVSMEEEPEAAAQPAESRRAPRSAC